MTQHLFNGFIIALVAISLWGLYQYLRTKRTPLQKFKPGTKVWFVDLHDSSPKSDYYTIKCLRIKNALIVKDGKQYFSIRQCDYLPSEDELFLNAKDVVKYLDKLKSESNE